MLVIEDTRQKASMHTTKHNWWENNGDSVIRCKLAFGDYALPPAVAVDTKQNLMEITTNICGNMAEKKRFREECKLAQKAGCKLIFLIENKKGITDVPDLIGQKIYIMSKRMISGDQLATAMRTIEGRYGCRFEFCHPDQAAERINKILIGEQNEEYRQQKND